MPRHAGGHGRNSYHIARNSPFAADSTALGAFPGSSPGAVLHGELAEVRVYDRALDDEERSSVEPSLATKYGIDSF